MDDMRTKIESDARQAYATPRLLHYGSVDELTEHVGAKGSRDGAVSGPKNTAL